ncbi:membrane-spanning 4-domains subfamily A member 12-like protein [Labeo rohita]|uniref:Membrane-spanning 4-domains subfamily A member 12-like protein n=1 Tax=Labeo rohita TaxID=84645 RepID=A0A498NZP1_LABRO|nr:membrane-spanning 4-domains subfamily A member 12-like protein [Labeo rohita]
MLEALLQYFQYSHFRESTGLKRADLDTWLQGCRIRRLLIAVVLNNVSTVLAVIGLAMYSCDLSSSLPYQMINGALDITMLIFFALQLCVTLSFSILICSKEETILCGKFVENPQFYKPLKEVTVSHVC